MTSRPREPAKIICQFAKRNYVGYQYERDEHDFPRPEDRRDGGRIGWAAAWGGKASKV
jgi:hypothetical protein